MAIPAQPTPTNICTEALKLFGKNSPSSADITRAKDYGLEIVKARIMEEGSNWDMLRTTSYQGTTAYISKYQAPTDFNVLIGVRIGEGQSTGTATAGTANTIRLEAVDAGMVGHDIVLTSGTGAGQKRQIISVNTSTLDVTVDEDWTTNPSTDSDYLVVDTWEKVEHHSVFFLGEVTTPSSTGKAQNIFHIADSAEGDFFLDTTPDKVYALEFTYYADLLKIDLDSTLYSRFLRLFNDTLIQGVFVWALQDDNRHDKEEERLKQSLAKKAGIYLYPNNVTKQGVMLDWE